MCCKNTNAKETHFGACCSRPDLYGIIIPGKHGKLFATLYSAGGEGPHPTVGSCTGIQTGRLSRNDIPLQRQLGEQRKLFPAKIWILHSLFVGPVFLLLFFSTGDAGAAKVFFLLREVLKIQKQS